MKTRNDPDLAHRLILHAARKAPAALCERLEEEWLADLQSRSGSVARLRLALGCCWATGVITRELGVPQLAASGAAASHRPLMGELRFDLPLLSRRTLSFLLIAGLHVLLIYAFATAFVQHVKVAIPAATHGEVIVETRPQPPPPPLTAGVSLTPVRTTDLVFTPPKDIDLNTDHDDNDLIRGTLTEPPGRQDAPPGRTVNRVPGGPGPGFPTTDDYYPDTSRRLAETGAATVRVCVDPQGRLTGDPALAQSSGTRRLDAAALKLARAGSGHYRPTTEDGEPVSSCYAYRIRFTLSN
jgi:TonB family protein